MYSLEFLPCGSGLEITGTGKALRSTEMTIEKWTGGDSTTRCNLASTNLSTFEVSFKVKNCFGAPGAIVIRNFHRNEFLLKAVTIELPGQEAVHFPCDSCIFNAESYTSDRTFFSNKVNIEFPVHVHGIPKRVTQPGRNESIRTKSYFGKKPNQLNCMILEIYKTH